MSLNKNFPDKPHQKFKSRLKKMLKQEIASIHGEGVDDVTRQVGDVVERFVSDAIGSSSRQPGRRIGDELGKSHRAENHIVVDSYAMNLLTKNIERFAEEMLFENRFDLYMSVVEVLGERFVRRHRQIAPENQELFGYKLYLRRLFALRILGTNRQVLYMGNGARIDSIIPAIDPESRSFDQSSKGDQERFIKTLKHLIEGLIENPSVMKRYGAFAFFPEMQLGKRMNTSTIEYGYSFNDVSSEVSVQLVSDDLYGDIDELNGFFNVGFLIKPAEADDPGQNQNRAFQYLMEKIR